jgi:GNAT superfamily N-acetyltransferase
MTRPEPFGLPGYRVAYLQTSDLAPLQDLLERCEDYFKLVSGKPPDPSGAENLLSDCPPGKDLESKFVLGVWLASGKLIAVLDVLQDYPGKGDWWLGLLLIDPHFRGQGLGRSLYIACDNWAAKNGANALLLGVLEANPGAFRFWKNLGFETLERRSPVQFSGREHIVIVMKRSLK